MIDKKDDEKISKSMNMQTTWGGQTHSGHTIADQPERSRQVLALGFSERRAADDLIQEIEGMLKDLLGEDFAAKVEAPTIPSKMGIITFRSRPSVEKYVEASMK
ncbi:unnamed protein product [Prorocentrum cordatum]|uniref:Uncharacterized protein n=1 Tax=Prorocentrum cordatum TaxID=2364126 RepID=A0ABN9TR40_9DINO|nr:unnamed protein product [Polarella glacialis]